MSRNYDVIVVGGGLSGLVLATALKRLGGSALAVVLVDGALARPRRHHRTSAVAPGPRVMLERLGIWQAVADRAAPVLRMEISDSRLADAVRIPNLTFDSRDVKGEARGEVLAHIAFHADLEDAAHQAATAVGVEFKAVHAATFEAGPSLARVRLADGEEIAARLVVSADGSRSPLRDQAGLKSVSWDYQRTAIAATLGHEVDHEGVAVQHFLESGPIAMLPLTGRRSSLIWTATSDEANDALSLTDDLFLAEVERRVGHRWGKLSLVDRPLTFPLTFGLARTFVAPRFALVGDAAHRIHPLAGQGLNLAMRDVGCLCDAIIEQASLGLDIGSDLTLKTYESARRFDSAVSAIGVDLLHHIYKMKGPLADLRRSGVAVVQNSRLLKRALLSEAMGLSGQPPRLFRAEKAAA
ncbi:MULTISPECIES: FAD-dependent monooxygenase [unclassified Beijerinckia]|uniref:FAD-dependent monooxygenase n=1 Tax=unclassified Beijerinckia TaxID=2638183 RepID=UPI000895F65E|nr:MULTISPECIES: FAD-dependent monooxygenase [unclassified Beijerinckia]MDH7798022.1 2-octaprenyl-6-methoxyphenol hydroxylase [Beijerinckia sp. GAS462]SED06245.1 2-octaprenyl-6-methoxyphenol hydroxylase [Beijerinckia sp. 28-YEA-48]